MLISRLTFALVYVLICAALVSAKPPKEARTNNMRPQTVPRVKYGGHTPRYVAPRPPSYVYRLYEYPPAAQLTAEAKGRMEAMNANKGRPVDWEDYTTVSACPHCPNRHAGGDCIPPTERKPSR